MVIAYSIHPGLISSLLLENMLPLPRRILMQLLTPFVGKSLANGAHITLQASMQPEDQVPSGSFISSSGRVFDYPHVLDISSVAATRLRNASQPALNIPA